MTDMTKEILRRRQDHSTVQSSLAMRKAPAKVRELVQSITQEQLVALHELSASLVRNGRSKGIIEVVDYLSGRCRDGLAPEARVWIEEIDQ